jgi:hypothetical protein
MLMQRRFQQVVTLQRSGKLFRRAQLGAASNPVGSEPEEPGDKVGLAGVLLAAISLAPRVHLQVY